MARRYAYTREETVRHLRALIAKMRENQGKGYGFSPEYVNITCEAYEHALEILEEELS